MSGSDRT
jgi:large subunit ribosomal protein L13e